MQHLPERLIAPLAQEYNKSLTIPTTRPQSQFILCPVGLIGSGKTTVSALLSKRFSLVRICGDDIRKILKKEGYNFDKVVEIAFKLVEEYLNKGHSICIDSDCVSEKTQKALCQAQASHNLKLAWIHICAPEDLILERLKNRDTSWMGTSEQMIDNYFQKKPLHENLSLPFLYKFDTSLPNLPQQVEEAVIVIGKFIDN